MPQITNQTLTVLVVDQNKETHFVIKEAIREAHKQTDIKYLAGKGELLDYLLRRNFYENCTDELPNIILLNVNDMCSSEILELNYLKDNVLLKHVKIFVLSKNLNQGNFRNCLEININGIYITATVKERLRLTVIEIIKRYFALIGIKRE
jgi:hypothetical protein